MLYIYLEREDVLIMVERSQSAPLNDVDYARWELPSFLIIHCCPFECLQTVYKPLATSQPFAEVHCTLITYHCPVHTVHRKENDVHVDTFELVVFYI